MIGRCVRGIAGRKLATQPACGMILLAVCTWLIIRTNGLHFRNCLHFLKKRRPECSIAQRGPGTENLWCSKAGKTVVVDCIQLKKSLWIPGKRWRCCLFISKMNWAFSLIGERQLPKCILVISVWTAKRSGRIRSLFAADLTLKLYIRKPFPYLQ